MTKYLTDMEAEILKSLRDNCKPKLVMARDEEGNIYRYTKRCKNKIRNVS